MKRFALVLPLMMLAACDSSPEVKADNAKPSEVAAKMRDAAGKGSFVRPGEWQQTVSLLKIEAPGMETVQKIERKRDDDQSDQQRQGELVHRLEAISYGR